MYLFIFEDQSLALAENVTDEDKQAADDGLIDIVEVKDSIASQYFDGKWQEVPRAGGS